MISQEILLFIFFLIFFYVNNNLCLEIRKTVKILSLLSQEKFKTHIIFNK